MRRLRCAILAAIPTLVIPIAHGDFAATATPTPRQGSNATTETLSLVMAVAQAANANCLATIYAIDLDGVERSRGPDVLR